MLVIQITTLRIMIAALFEIILLLGFLDHRSLRLFGRLPAAGLMKSEIESGTLAPQCGGFKAVSLAALAAALTAVFERVIALGVALHGVVVLTALVHAYRVSLRAGVEAGISFADLC